MRGFSLFICRQERLKVLRYLSHNIWMITVIKQFKLFYSCCETVPQS
jgi:hypothetical protein